jgi:glycosyltransferase involved in cell wall biosynthesis
VKILYTVQRYGTEIVGGSEAACRMFAERLVQRGHDVEVVTSCARKYTDWENEYEPGTEEISGVIVHRLPVVAPRSDAEFGPLNAWTILGPRPIPLFQQQRWMQLMGPRLDQYQEWLMANVDRFDVVIHMTYLYGSTTSGLPVTAGRVPTILQPTAHDEPAIWVREYDSLFRLPDAFLFFTPEERDTVQRRFGFEPVGSVVGIGMDIDPPSTGDAFRSKFHIAAPYLLYVGRIDHAKGATEAVRYFTAYKERNPGPLRFVLAGDPIVELPSHPDVETVGFLDEAMKQSALAGSLALLQPSYFESFSLVLCEAWLQGRPALVQGASDVLAGQARRAGGAVPYDGFAQFESALDLLLAEPELADRMGVSGRAYVEDRYVWSTVLDAVESTIDDAISRFRSSDRHR